MFRRDAIKAAFAAVAGLFGVRKAESNPPVSVCEKCGKQATHSIADLIQLAPVRKDTGELVRAWDVHSVHHFCDDHKRDPIEYQPCVQTMFVLCKDDESRTLSREEFTLEYFSPYYKQG